jgi:hypothetical protein
LRIGKYNSFEAFRYVKIKHNNYHGRGFDSTGFFLKDTNFERDLTIGSISLLTIEYNRVKEAHCSKNNTLCVGARNMNERLVKETLYLYIARAM